nr:hypothetical protein [Tanacetum cinerariifolium]
RMENDKLIGLNERIAEAEEEIGTLEAHLEIIGAAIKSEYERRLGSLFVR